MGAGTLEVTAEPIPEEEGGYTVYCPELDSRWEIGLEESPIHGVHH